MVSDLSSDNIEYKRKLKEFSLGSISVSIWLTDDSDEQFRIYYKNPYKNQDFFSVQPHELAFVRLASECAFQWLKNRSHINVPYLVEEKINKLSHKEILENIEERKLLLLNEDQSFDNDKSFIHWWKAFEDQNKNNPRVILLLIEELISRQATIEDYFHAYAYSDIYNIAGNIHYFDFCKRLSIVSESITLCDNKDLIPYQDEVRAWLNYDEATGEARDWWQVIEINSTTESQTHVHLAFKILEKHISLDEAYLRAVYADTFDVNAYIHFLDYYDYYVSEHQSKKDNISTSSGRLSDFVRSATVLYQSKIHHLMGKDARYPIDYGKKLGEPRYSGTNIQSCYSCNEYRLADAAECIHCKNKDQNVTDAKQAFDKRIIQWSSALKRYPGQVSSVHIAHFAKLLQPDLLFSIENGCPIDLSKIAKEFEQSIQYLVHEKEIAARLLYELPLINEVSGQALCALLSTFFLLEQRFPITTKVLGIEIDDSRSQKINSNAVN